MSAYQTFYYIPWPDCQGFSDYDEYEEHTFFSPDLSGIFAEKEWIDKINMEDGRVL